MPAPTISFATNAASSGVHLERQALKKLSKRSDKHGVLWLSLWSLLLLLSASTIPLSLDAMSPFPLEMTWYTLPCLILYGTILALSSYALSHECAHGTAFRTRPLNELCLWLGSLIYYEEPYHRRYSHTRHHTYTWHVGKDSQMPFATPMTLSGWLLEISGIALVLYETKIFFRNALGKFSSETLDFTPPRALWQLRWGARACLALYAMLAALIACGYSWPVLYILLPRLLGGPVMLLFTLLQHVELRENSPSILHSTRSFTTNWLGRFLYMNMNNHIEHHLYPQVPFHALPRLRLALAEQVPAPDRGFWRSTGEVFSVVVRRSLGLSSKARSLRQAPEMIGGGQPQKVGDSL